MDQFGSLIGYVMRLRVDNLICITLLRKIGALQMYHASWKSTAGTLLFTGSTATISAGWSI